MVEAPCDFALFSFSPMMPGKQQFDRAGGLEAARWTAGLNHALTALQSAARAPCRAATHAVEGLSLGKAGGMLAHLFRVGFLSKYFGFCRCPPHQHTGTRG